MFKISLLVGIALALAQALPAAEAPLPIEPIYRLQVRDGKQRFATAADPDFTKIQSQIEGLAFRAVCTNVWLPGLVPIFAVEKTNRFELRRRPARGQENGAEALFFAVPLADEPEAVQLAGRWGCEAIRGSGSRADITFELTIETNTVAGRFDQYTEYRFAYVNGGTYTNDHLELKVEYINDLYFLSAIRGDSSLSGTWRRADNNEKGTWKGRRARPIQPAEKDLVPLYEWRRGLEHRYTTEHTATPHDGWTSRPLCRVWRRK